jgi:hypothetical protein
MGKTAVQFQFELSEDEETNRLPLSEDTKRAGSESHISQLELATPRFAPPRQGALRRS